MLPLLLGLVIIIAFVTIPFVYFLADEKGKRFFAMFYGLVIIVGGGYGVVAVLFGAAVFLWEFAGSLLGFRSARPVDADWRFLLIGIVFIVSSVLLYFTAGLVDPGPQKRFLRKNSTRAGTKPDIQGNHESLDV